MIKFLEWSEKSEIERRQVRGLILTGDDDFYQSLVEREFTSYQPGKGNPEEVRVADLVEISCLLREGSFYGPRMFRVEVVAKVKNTDAWARLPGQVARSLHSILVRFESEGAGPTGMVVRSGSPLVVVECRFPRTAKERARVVEIRSRARGVVLDGEMVQEVASRARTSTEVETVLTVLHLVAATRGRVVLRDVERALGAEDPAQVRTRSLFGGNMTALFREVDGLEPIYLLTSWITALQRFYYWLALESAGKGEAPVSDDDPEGPVGVKVNKFQLKDYVIAKKLYSRPLVREVIEDLDRVYQDLRRGRTSDWKERAKLAVLKLAAKN